MKKNKSLKSMTRLEAEKESKRRAEESLEELDTLGQENETKAAKWVIEKEKDNLHTESEKKAEAEWKLHDARKTVWTYNDSLVDEMIRMILMSDVPPGYRLAPRAVKEGMQFWIRDKEGSWYVKGMTISGIPKYDLNGLDRNLEKALNFIDSLEENPAKAGPKNETTIITTGKL